MPIGSLIREFDFDPTDNEPVMRLRPKVTPTNDANPFTKHIPRCFDIRLDQAFLFADPPTGNERWQFEYCKMICEKFQLGKISPRKFFEIITLIQDGLDQLVHAPPKEAVFDDRPKVVGEGTLVADGQKLTFDITDEMRDDVEKSIRRDLN
jgi:hypothetical protein